jgi:hypothetical protein
MSNSPNSTEAIHFRNPRLVGSQADDTGKFWNPLGAECSKNSYTNNLSVVFSALKELESMVALSDFLWGKGNKALDALIDPCLMDNVDVPSLDDIGETRNMKRKIYNLQSIPGYKRNVVLATKFYVRDEYGELDNFIQRRVSDVLLTGHPGVVE